MDDEIMMSGNGYVLPGSYEAGPNDSGTEHSVRKLHLAAEDLKTNLPKHVTIESVTCKAEAETWAYRCRCTFQIVNDCDGNFHYAMRTQGKAIPIGAPFFPIATRRIQEAMTTLIEDILTSSDFSDMVRGLTSLTFSSAWHDTPEADCIVTLMYGEPVDETKWKAQAMAACQQMRLRQLYGSAKKCLLTAMPDDESRSTLRDSVYLHKASSWIVSLTPLDNTITGANIEVQYEKPNTAFFHPNSFAMKDALHWILDRLSYIVGQEGDSSSCRMLELYCGCGAHTVAVGKSGMVEDITAIELDHRLIEACKRNVRLNGLEDIVTVVQSDAGAWAKRSCKSIRSNYYDILLVDPPRAGLDQDVCSMAKKGGFVHFLYISCGHRALLRDLERLSDCFDVIHCRQLDLFPRTDSIETLVHLRRRQKV